MEEEVYADVLLSLNLCSVVDFNGSQYASYRTASDMERHLAIDNYYLHHAHEADPTAQTRPSLHIQTQGNHTIFRIDSTGVLQQFTGTSLETCRPVKIEECSLSIASGGRLAGLQTDDSTFVLIFENSAGHLESVRLQQGRLNRLPTFPVDREPDSAFIAVNETYDTFKVYYQHRDKHIHCLVADTGSGRWNAGGFWLIIPASGSGKVL
ncbi:hypothetical protein BJX68DRAFT_269394 [Aspergillus pseudodeflectus]|uniref:Fucose-specific lectin n=1 Tax=Aspergillus pseudodeflectus TaxID=176178 RepID=A0ABR4K124_9EURO